MITHTGQTLNGSSVQMFIPLLLQPMLKHGRRCDRRLTGSAPQVLRPIWPPAVHVVRVDQQTELGIYSQESSIISLRTSSSTATPMLSLVITLFSIASEPSELAMASWLNSTVCFCIALNLEQQDKTSHINGSKTRRCNRRYGRYCETNVRNWRYTLVRFVENCTAVNMFAVRL